MSIDFAQTHSIRKAGRTEYWLQDQIWENPACLGLGELEAVSKERGQASGGRLDLLLKNSEDESMYEVEIMLGETDESHIIRTIEYWDNEKRRWPQRQHYAVLVAESITRRFFNVIQLLSHSIPVIAIQVNLIEVSGQQALHFTKVLDTYEEPDDGGEAPKPATASDWQKKAPWVLEIAETMRTCLADTIPGLALGFTKSYVSLGLENSFFNYFAFRKRSGGKSLVSFRVASDSAEAVKAWLDEKDVSYTLRKQRIFYFTFDKSFVQEHHEMLKNIAVMVKDDRG